LFSRQGLRDSDVVTIHRLVQSVIRDGISDSKRLILKNAIVRSALEGFPDHNDGQNMGICRKYRLDAITAMDYLLAYLSGAEAFMPASGIYRVAAYLWYDGYYKMCSALYEQTLEALGPEHPDTLRSMHSLAGVRQPGPPRRGGRDA